MNNQRLTKAVAAEITGGLSNPSKMPDRAFGLSAHDCQTGSRLQKCSGSVCESCYALIHSYTWPSTINAHARRMARLTAALAGGAAADQWVAAMAKLIGADETFRWLDSGDIQSPDMLDLMFRVAEATPGTIHWIPTKEPRYVKRLLATGRTIPANVNIRISAPMIDQAPIQVPAGCTQSTVIRDTEAPGFRCGAADRGGICGDCRACWDRSVPVVSYPYHQ